MKKSAQVPARDGAMQTGDGSVPGILRSGPRKAGEATRERMLDAAEVLFAEHGYHGTSMRDVAEATESRIALVTYHFGTKDVLFEKVVERRAAHMAHVRMQALDEGRTKAGSRPVALEDLIAGYVWPFVERSVNGGQGWKNYSRFVARLSNTPAWAKVIGVHYDAVARQYLAEFRRTLSRVSEEDICHAFGFMVSTMVGIMAEPGRVESLSLGKYNANDLDAAYRRMLPFLVSGFKALEPSRTP